MLNIDFIMGIVFGIVAASMFILIYTEVVLGKSFAELEKSFLNIERYLYKELELVTNRANLRYERWFKKATAPYVVYGFNWLYEMNEGGNNE